MNQWAKIREAQKMEIGHQAIEEQMKTGANIADEQIRQVSVLPQAAQVVQGVWISPQQEAELGLLFFLKIFFFQLIK